MRIHAAWGLDIGTSSLKLARVEDAGGRLTVQTFGPVALPSDAPTASPDALAQGLDTLLTSAGARRASITASLPRSAATLKFPRLPRTTQQQAAQMIRFEAQRYIPFAIEDVVLSFQELPRHSDTEVTSQGVAEQMEILLVAVRRDVVVGYRAAMSAAGSPLSHLSISTMGIWNAVHHSPIAVDPDEALVVLDVGGHSSTVVAFHAGEMIFNRSAGWGSDSLTQALMAEGDDRVTAESRKRDYGLTAGGAAHADGPLLRQATREEDWAQQLVSEVRRSLAALRGEHRTLRVERIFLTGGGSKTPGLAEYLESALGLPAQPLELAGLVSDPQFIEAAGIALGALDHGVATIDLVPEEIERERRKRREAFRVRLAVAAGVVVLAGLVVLGINTLRAQQVTRDRIAAAQKQVDTANKKLSAVKTANEMLTEQAGMLQTALRPDHTWLDVLQDVSDRTPKGIWYSGIDLEKGKQLNLRGTAIDQASVQSLWSNLRRSPLLTRANLDYSNQAKVSEKPVFQFGIRSDIIGNKDKPSKPVKRRATRKAAASTSGSDTGAGTP